MNFALGIIALAIAGWQLWLQRKEIKRNGRVSALTNISQLLSDRIALHSKIIDDCKRENKPWKSHADRINNHLRPQLQKVNQEIFAICKGYDFSFPLDDVESVLKINPENGESEKSSRTE